MKKKIVNYNITLLLLSIILTEMDHRMMGIEASLKKLSTQLGQVLKANG